MCLASYVSDCGTEYGSNSWSVVNRGFTIGYSTNLGQNAFHETWLGVIIWYYSYQLELASVIAFTLHPGPYSTGRKFKHEISSTS